jgi:peptide/nickel transport system permease protein
MYWKYCLRRIGYGVAIYIVIIFIFSALFNATMERTVKSRIEEEIHADFVSLKTTMKPEEINNYFAERRILKYRLYHLDQPIWNRIVWQTIDTLTLNLGKATIIKSSAGEEDVWTIIAECTPRTMLLFTTAVVIDILLGNG